MFATYILLFCRSTLALVFLFSLGGKLLAFRDFVVTIGDFKLLPRRWSKAVAWFVLGSELITAALLICGGEVLPPGFLLALVLLTVFSVALGLALRRKIAMSCTCFGRTERRISRYDVVRNVCLICYGLVGLWMVRETPQNVTIGEFILLVFMSAVFLLVVTNLKDIVETLGRPLPVREERR